ncbi:uncharacterized protein LOC117220973 [Megalopta genalis]|uniref:uncharacterized protein LOC117220973 n=1 Tax=Megalopta genalis TaxID=115081 RepID=UPI0014430DEB|nr:uncharacterized protein LOC117220973 [Megalopta genalis]XP_033327382.1 uncharacterized protein LOC117220974 [Megalopta genalis]
MSIMEMFHLTHPEVLSEPELREILENCCIDFNNYKHLSRSQLIELYKRVAMPLPKREDENSENLDNKKINDQEKKNSVDDCQRDIASLNGTHNTKRSISEIKSSPSSCATKPKSPVNEFKQTSKKIRLCNSNNLRDFNDSDKRINDGKHDEAPSKKRQKITWP